MHEVRRDAKAMREKIARRERWVEGLALAGVTLYVIFATLR